MRALPYSAKADPMLVIGLDFSAGDKSKLHAKSSVSSHFSCIAKTELKTKYDKGFQKIKSCGIFKLKLDLILSLVPFFCYSREVT